MRACISDALAFNVDAPLNMLTKLHICSGLMVINSFIEKTYVVGTHCNYLIGAFPMYTYRICY